MFRSTAVAAVLAVSLLSACGSDESDHATTTKAATTTATSTGTALPPSLTPDAPTPTTPAPPPTPSPKQIIAQCHAAFDPMVDALRQLEGKAKLEPGFAAYNAAITEAQVGYGKADFTKAPKVSTNCAKTVLLSSVKSFQNFDAATTTWSKCAKAKGCTDASVAPQLRKQWKTARRFLHKAESGFSDPTLTTS